MVGIELEKLCVPVIQGESIYFKAAYLPRDQLRVLEEFFVLVDCRVCSRICR